MSATPRTDSIVLRWTGAIGSLSAADRGALFDRSTSSDELIRSRTAAILARVRN